MTRIILRVVTRDQGHVFSSLETLDIDCPTLEAALRRNGFGGGPNGDDFMYTEILGAHLVGGEVSK